MAYKTIPVNNSAQDKSTNPSKRKKEMFRYLFPDQQRLILA